LLANACRSTARRYGQFGERLIARLGSPDLRDLPEEDVAEFVTAEFRDRRAKDPTINATVLLRSVMRAALAARDVYPRAHLADDPLPRIATIARRTARKLWAPALDDEARAAAWTPEEVATVFGAARSDAPAVYGVCLFQYSTGCRIGEVLASPSPEPAPEEGTPAPAPMPRSRRLAWADLMQRVFALDVLECPRCRGRMRLVAAIHPPEATTAILECLGLSARAPPPDPARADPETDTASSHE